MNMDATLSLIVGACVAGVVGLVTVCFSNFADNRRRRKSILRALLSEIELNQSHLENQAVAGASLRKLSENRKVNGSMDEETRSIYEKVITKNGYDLSLLRKACFDTTVYSNASRDLGLLNPKIRSMIVSYYGGLLWMECTLGNLYEISASPEKNRKTLFKDAIKESKTKEYFDKAEECFNLGTELIKKINEA